MPTRRWGPEMSSLNYADGGRRWTAGARRGRGRGRSLVLKSRSTGPRTVWKWSRRGVSEPQGVAARDLERSKGHLGRLAVVGSGSLRERRAAALRPSLSVGLVAVAVCERWCDGARETVAMPVVCERSKGFLAV